MIETPSGVFFDRVELHLVLSNYVFPGHVRRVYRGVDLLREIARALVRYIHGELRIIGILIDPLPAGFGALACRCGRSGACSPAWRTQSRSRA